MRILITTDVIHAGGAETFVLRLAQALQQAGHTVTIYPLYKNQVDYKIIQAFAPDVAVVPAQVAFLRALQRADGLLRKLNIDGTVVNYLLARHLKKQLLTHGIEVVHSHLFTADLVAVQAASALGIPVVSTIHGDYANYSRRVDGGEVLRIANFYKKAHGVLKKLCAVVCISDEQLQFFKTRFGHLHLKPVKIYNGYTNSSQHRHLTRQDAGIEAGVFVFGMVARGIPEKGWEEVIAAFSQLGLANTCLLLVGDSDYVGRLKEKYSTVKQIIFAGYSSNPIEYIKLFDVGLFASTYFSESLPTVLIEYLSCGVPVVSVAIAECRNMLASSQGDAGILVELQDGNVPVALFAKAMHTVATNKPVYQHLATNTTAAVQKFNMQACVEAYENVYKGCIHA